MSTTRHPAHDELVQAVRDWFHEPFQEMGYQAERRRWGTYWSTRHVYIEDLHPDHVDGFLENVRAYYEDRPVYINVDGRALDAALGPALRDAGCVPGKTEIFLAHVGPPPEPFRLPGLAVERVSTSNVEDFAWTKLQAFAEREEAVDPTEVAREVDQRLGDLRGTGNGLVARMEGEVAGIIWWYEQDEDLWIVLLGTRARFRDRGIATWLLTDRIREAYARGFRSVMINVMTDNAGAIRLYRRLGFRDEVTWRRRYLVQAA